MSFLLSINQVLCFQKRVRNIFLFIPFLFLFHFSKSQTTTAGLPELKGAELYTTTYSKGSVTIYLTAWYNGLTGSVPGFEAVSVYESGIHSEPLIVELTKDTDYIKQGSALSCRSAAENKTRIVKYSRKIDLGLQHANYDISWAMCCFDRSTTNVNTDNRDAITLTVHLDNPSDLEKHNRMPYITDAPVLLLCTGTSSNISLTAKDHDSDEVSYRFSTPYSNRSVGHSHPPHVDAKYRNEAVIHDPGYNGSFLTSQPPFTPSAFKTNYSDEKPADAETITLDAKKGQLNYKKIKMGKYIITINISDSKNNKLISEHQAFFILEVL